MYSSAPHVLSDKTDVGACSRLSFCAEASACRVNKKGGCTSHAHDRAFAFVPDA